MIAKQTDQQLRILLQTMYQGRIVIRVKRVVENGIMNYLITDKRKKGFQILNTYLFENVIYMS
jgi:hypothetical protein